MGAAGPLPSEVAAGASSQGEPAAELELLRRRLAAAELRAREREETAALRLRELEAMEEDLRALDRHTRHLEHDRLVLEIEIDQLRRRAGELFGDLERDEARIAELQARLAGGAAGR